MHKEICSEHQKGRGGTLERFGVYVKSSIKMNSTEILFEGADSAQLAQNKAK
jgi:hypothetical protein